MGTDDFDPITLRKVILMRTAGYDAKDIAEHLEIPSISAVLGLCSRYRVVPSDPRPFSEIMFQTMVFHDDREKALCVLEVVNEGKSYQEYLDEEYYRRNPDKKA